MVIERGEIWWADLGEPRGSSPGFHRPIVIIQSNDFNQTNIKTLIGAVITSNLRLAEMPGNVRLPKKFHSLEKESVVNVTQLFTINKEDLFEYVETLSEQKMEQIDKGLRLVLSI
ncbi:MAG: type II toxin-antitoxin system PemK/MazF family toxin [Pyrinomonadaceae bacterium]|jgi:mRNA interferase MazF|nr:type II toxin-antitoxin system PemK/MazF family toxin [Pyrinomonadaceae bacterium]